MPQGMANGQWNSRPDIQNLTLTIVVTQTSFGTVMGGAAALRRLLYARHAVKSESGLLDTICCSNPKISCCNC